MKKSIIEQKRLREQSAIRSARYRERSASKPPARDVDKAISEALAVHAASLPRTQAEALLEAVTALATDGLRYQDYGHNSSRIRVVRRLKTWISSNPKGGSVRAARDRASVTASLSSHADTPVTPANCVTPAEIA